MRLSTLEDLASRSAALSEVSVAVCCSVLQCVAVCCSVLQCVVKCGSEMRLSTLEDLASRSAALHEVSVAVCCSVLQCFAGLSHCCIVGGYGGYVLQCVAVSCGALQCVVLKDLASRSFTLSEDNVAVRCIVCCSVLQCVAVCCSFFQCVAVCCSVLQCVASCVAVRCRLGVSLFYIVSE